MANEKQLIDANAFIADHCADCRLKRDGMCTDDDLVCGSVDMLKDFPTVDAVEVVHAHWEDGYAVDHNGKKVYDSIDCSHCEEVFKIESHDREYWKQRFKVCPFCGAIMDVERREGE